MNEDFTSICLSFLTRKMVTLKTIISTGRALIAFLVRSWPSCCKPGVGVRVITWKTKAITVLCLVTVAWPFSTHSIGYCSSPALSLHRACFPQGYSHDFRVGLQTLPSSVHVHTGLTPPPPTLVSFYLPIHYKVFSVETMPCVFLYSLHCLI